MMHPPELRRAMSCFVVFAVASAGAHAATITLSPGQSIQATIDAAGNGDQIELLPGTYAQLIDFKGKAIQIVGIGGSGSTILDGTGLGDSVVTFDSGETTTSILRGVTVRGGSVSGKAGGGIRCANGSGPLIRDCRIVANTAVKGSALGVDHGGGGIGAVDSGPRIEHCYIAGNSGSKGGGILMFGATMTVLDCVIESNTGGGIFAELGGTLELRRSRIEDNSGPGAKVEDVNLFSSDCVFARNTNRGLYYDQGYGDITLTRHVFLDNTTTESGGGGGLLAFTGPTHEPPEILVENCLFAGNTAPIGSAASLTAADESFEDQPPESIRVESCTFVNNGPGSTLSSGEPGLWIHNSIVRGTAPVFQKYPWADSATIAVASYSNIQGGFVGVSITDVDPQFVDPSANDFHLRAGSPSLDSGDPSGPTPLRDLDDDSRGAAGTNDLGCDERRPLLEIAGDLGAGGVARIAIHDVPQVSPAILFLSASLGPGFAGFGLGNPFVFVTFPVIPASGYLAATAIVPSGIQPITVYGQAWTGSALTAVDRIELW